MKVQKTAYWNPCEDTYVVITAPLQFPLWLDLQSLLYSSMNHTSVFPQSPTFKADSSFFGWKRLTHTVLPKSLELKG